ncbi:MAG: DUF1800 domain-containing protein [Verrucomicrobiales bacterium]|nr:DUF1800 domain-containing protein [Verrucomicrobiales bacterium]
MLSPISPSNWNETTASHLLNRAGFGGTPAEVSRLVELGPEQAVSSFVDYERIPDPAAPPEWAKPDPTRAERFLAARTASQEERMRMRQEEDRTQRERLLELRQWWVSRMVLGRRPLQEKLTLFWHGHFATSFQKVRDAYLMWMQNDIFRQNACGPWLTLLTKVSKDPAMLVWLDQAQSRRQHPNENFAREVMELFTLGEGHYTEMDVTEAARAFTGWSIDRADQKFTYRPRLHDPTLKTVLGRTGDLKGDDVLKTILQQPQADRFITAKLWTFFASENPTPELVAALAAGFRATGQTFKPLLRRIFLSEEFYSPSVMRQQVKSPVQWLVGSVRMLERELPPPLVTVNALRLLGQDLFAPPNVKGWDGGLSWITTNSLLNRYNLAGYLVLGDNPFSRLPERAKGRMKNRPLPAGPRISAKRLVADEEGKDPSRLVQSLQRRLLGSPLPEKKEKTLLDYLKANEPLDDADILHLIRLIMSTPEFQLA